MPYLVIENFKRGLDKRRHPLMADPGTLWELVGGHITSGGEIERKPNYGLFDFAFSPNVHGLLPTSAGVYSFGSDASPGVFTTQYHLYQRLQHPAVLKNPSLYNVSKHLMTGIAASTVYENKPWVAATFADGKTFCYYDGALIEAFRNGLILDGLTSTEDVAEHIKDVIDSLPNILATRSGSAITISGEGGAQYTLDISATTPENLAINHINDGSLGVPGVEGTGLFRIVYGAVGGEITAIKVNEVNIIDPTIPIPFDTSTDITVAAVATAINTYVPSVANLDYKANNEGNTVFIKALASVGDDANTFVVEVTVSGPMVLGECAFRLNGNGVADVIDTITNPSAVDLLDGNPVPWATSNDVWAANTATAINDNAADYVATSNGNILYIGKKITRSDDIDEQIDINYTDGNGGTIDDEDVTATPDPNPLSVSVTNNIIRYPIQIKVVSGFPRVEDGSVTEAFFRSPTSIGLAISGGTPPYYGFWNYIDTGTSNAERYITPDIFTDPFSRNVSNLNPTGESWAEPIFHFTSSSTFTLIADWGATDTYLGRYRFRLTIFDSSAIPKQASTDLFVDVYASLDLPTFTDTP